MEKRNFRKRIALWIGIGLAGAAFLVGLHYAGVIIRVWNASRWQFNAEFEAYEAEILLVKDYVETMSNEAFSQYEFVYVSPIKDESGNYDYSEYDIYSPSQKRYLNCPAEVKEALLILNKEAFKPSGGLSMIRRNDEGDIAFHSEQPYYLVYSPNGDPEKILPLNHSEDACSRKIQRGWYHLIV